MANQIAGAKEVTTFTALSPEDYSQKVHIIKVVSDAKLTYWFIRSDESEFPLHNAVLESNRKAIKIWYSKDDEEPTELIIEKELKSFQSN